MALKLMCASNENHLVCNSGPHHQTEIFTFLKHIISNPHFVKHWSGTMGETYYHAHVTDEETEVQRG